MGVQLGRECTLTSPFQTACVQLAEFIAPEPNGFVAHADSALGEQILDVTVTQIKSEI